MSGCFVLKPFPWPKDWVQADIVPVQLAEAAGLEISNDIFCGEDIPPYDLSLRDGWAVKSSTVPVVLEKNANIQNGADPVVLNKGTTRWINTGGYLPIGADAVLAAGETEDSTESKTIEIEPTYPGENVLTKGSEWEKGELIFKKGTRLGAAELALLRDAGINTVNVRKRIMVGVLPTGSELRIKPFSKGQNLPKRFSSDALYLDVLLRNIGLTAEVLPPVEDDPKKILEGLRSGSSEFKCDCVIVIGGTGRGRSDSLRKALELGNSRFWENTGEVSSSLPFVLAQCGPVNVIGLPGNPLGMMAIAQRFVLPYMWSLMHSSPYPVNACDAELGFDMAGKLGDHCVELAKLDGNRLIALPVEKGSGRSRLFRDVAGIVKNSDGKPVPAGSKVKVELFLDSPV